MALSQGAHNGEVTVRSRLLAIVARRGDYNLGTTEIPLETSRNHDLAIVAFDCEVNLDLFWEQSNLADKKQEKL